LKKRQLLFIRDATIYTFTSFGGPQAHVAILLREFVEKRNYISEEELMELVALSQLNNAIRPNLYIAEVILLLQYKFLKLILL